MSNRSDSPLVSLVIPTHGRRELLQQTLESVFSQTMTNWEAIVVDDRSPDDTAQYLAQSANRDPRLRPMSRHGNFGGANIARNQGVAASRGKYVIFLDSDDLLEPDCLELRTAHLERHPRLDFSVHAMRCFASNPNDTDHTWNTLTEEDDFERYLRMDGPWQTTGATWRRTALDRVGPWDPQLLSLQDLDFHIRALSAGLRYQKINAWDCHYRLPHHRKAISSEKRSLAQFRSHVRIADRLLALPDAVLDDTPNRRDLLAGLCFYFADRCAQRGDLPSAIKLWNRARSRGIARGRRFAEGVIMLMAEKQKSLSTLAKRRILSKWPKSWRMIFRGTFLTGPLPPRASASFYALSIAGPSEVRHERHAA